MTIIVPPPGKVKTEQENEKDEKQEGFDTMITALKDIFVADSYEAMRMGVLYSTIKDIADAGEIVGAVLPDNLQPFMNIRACSEVAGFGFIAGVIYGVKMERLKNKMRRTQDNSNAG